MTRLATFLLILLLGGCATGTAPRPVAGQPAITGALGDLCGSQIALLGEGAGHGDGRTLALKAALVPLLVDRCGFEALLFEGSSYDFLELERRQRRGQPVTRAMVSSAVGGLWNRYEEMQPLITWLHERLVAGRLRLGGFDDQLGSAGAFYSNGDLPAELSGNLAAARASQCREEFRRRIYGEVGTSAAERAPLAACLGEIRAALAAAPPGADRDERLHMLANVERYAARDWSDGAAHMRERDRSMWLNYQWLRQRIGPRRKLILWGATVHLARDAGAYPEFAGGGNLGSYLHRAHGPGAFFLGFAAASGSHLSGNALRQLPPAQAGSLEAAVLAHVANGGGDPVYVGPSALRRLGRRAGSVFGPEPVTASWGAVVDGVVIFREQRPPTRMQAR